MTLSRKSQRRLSAFALSALVATLSALWWPPERNVAFLDPILHPLQQLEWFGYDTLFHWRGIELKGVDPRIVIVGYSQDTERAIVPNKVYPWPPPRAFHGQVVDNLVRDGATVIAFDVLMSEPSLSGIADDQKFDAALKRSGDHVVLACRVNRDETEGGGESAARKVLVAPYHDDEHHIDLESSVTEAFVDVPTEKGTMRTDEIVRSIYPLQKFQGDWLPSLAGAAFLKMTGRKIEDSRATNDAIWLGGYRLPRTGPIIVDPLDPENDLGTSYMDFPGGSHSFPIYRYEDVYSGQFPAGTFRNKVVFIGVSGLEQTRKSGDYFLTAYSHLSPENDGGEITRDVYGVVVQGQMLNALLHRAFISQAAPWQTWIIMFLFSLMCSATVRNTLNWRGPILLIFVLIAFMLLVFSCFLNLHLYFPWVFPGLLLLGSSAGVAWFERGQMRKMWASTVSPAYMEVMLREGYESKPRRHEATVIFGDIRGFTTFSEKHEPETVVELLDKHLAKLVTILFAERGNIDKFLGDGIMAVFGAPIAQEDAARRAVRACWNMRKAALEPVVDEAGNPHVLATGFGVATGPFVAGHVGSRDLSSFTLIGDTVNLSARLQAVTGQPDVIIDGATYAEVRPYVDAEFLGERTLKGKSEAIACYKVLAWYDDPGDSRLLMDSATESPVGAPAGNPTGNPAGTPVEQLTAPAPSPDAGFSSSHRE